MPDYERRQSARQCAVPPGIPLLCRNAGHGWRCAYTRIKKTRDRPPPTRYALPYEATSTNHRSSGPPRGANRDHCRNRRGRLGFGDSKRDVHGVRAAHFGEPGDPGKRRSFSAARSGGVSAAPGAGRGSRLHPHGRGGGRYAGASSRRAHVDQRDDPGRRRALGSGDVAGTLFVGAPLAGARASPGGSHLGGMTRTAQHADFGDNSGRERARGHVEGRVHPFRCHPSPACEKPFVGRALFDRHVGAGGGSRGRWSRLEGRRRRGLRVCGRGARSGRCQSLRRQDWVG